MPNSDIKMVRVTATGSAHAGPARIVGYHVNHSAAGLGRLTITDGSGGSTVLDVDYPAAAGVDYAELTQGGIRCSTNIWVSAATNITSATIFYVG